MSDTATRLAAYKAAELRILQAQDLAHGDRRQRLAELSQVQAAIKELEAQLAAENRGAAGASGPVTLVAGFDRKIAGAGRSGNCEVPWSDCRE